MAVREDVQMANSPSRCPYCHDGLDSLEEINACAGCGARHHSDCFSEHGACASCGEGTRLVPEVSAPRGISLIESLEVLPTKEIKVRHKTVEGEADVSWPMLPEEQKAATLWLALLTLPLLFGIYMLYWYWCFGASKTRFSLESDYLHFERPGGRIGGLSVEATREEVEKIEFKGGALWVTVRGKNEYWVSSAGVGHVLKKEEIEKIYNTLQAWKDKRVARRPVPKTEAKNK